MTFFLKIKKHKYYEIGRRCFREWMIFPFFHLIVHNESFFIFQFLFSFFLLQKKEERKNTRWFRDVISHVVDVRQTLLSGINNNNETKARQWNNRWKLLNLAQCWLRIIYTHIFFRNNIINYSCEILFLLDLWRSQKY